jgi:hypothetical protein
MFIPTAVRTLDSTSFLYVEEHSVTFAVIPFSWCTTLFQCSVFVSSDVNLTEGDVEYPSACSNEFTSEN